MTLDLPQTVQTVEKLLGRTHNHMPRYVSTAARRTLHKSPPQDRDIILRIKDLKDMIPKDEQARKMCIATELTVILPNEPDIDLVMNQGVEAMITGTEDGEIMNDGLVHPTANRVAQDLQKEDHMTGVDSPREAKEAGVRGEEVEKEIGIVMSVTVKNNMATTGEDRMVTEAAATRNTTGVTATPAQGDVTQISFALIKEGRTVALIRREGLISIIEEVVDRILMIGNLYFCPIAAV